MSRKWMYSSFLGHCPNILRYIELKISKSMTMPSTVIEHFSYDQATSMLKITFRSGNVYVYKNVPQRVYNELKGAGSKGGYFNRFIKYSYEFEHLLAD